MVKHLYSFLVIALFTLSCKEKTPIEAKVQSKTDTILQKTGVVLTYTQPNQPLSFLKRDQTLYTENYQNRLRKIAEYYIQNSQQKLIHFHRNKSESKLGYSLEQNDWEGVNYTQIGIFNKSGNNIATLQWLFYEPKSQQLYEFDLYKKQLTLFNLK